MARNNLHAISFGLWRTQTYDRHMLQSDSHLKPFQLLHGLANVEKLSPHHDNIVCHQQYDIVETGNVFFIVVTMKAQAKNNLHAISFGLWHTQTYDRHMLRSDSHLKPFRLPHGLDNVKKQSPHHNGIVCRQQYDIVKTGN